SDATLQNTMLSDRIGSRLTRSTSSPTGIVNTAPTSSVTELSRPIFVLPMCRACASWGATAPTVAVSAPLRASTAPTRGITGARAGPPTRFTTSPRTKRAAQRVMLIVVRPAQAATSLPVIGSAPATARPVPGHGAPDGPNRTGLGSPTQY